MSEDVRDPELQTPPEPSVLDYVKSKLSFGRRAPIVIPGPEPRVVPAPAPVAAVQVPRLRESLSAAAAGFPWRSLAALGVALLAQGDYEPPHTTGLFGTLLYLVAFGFLLWSAVRGEWRLSALAATSEGTDPLSFRRTPFLFSIPLAILSFLLFTGNRFTAMNLAPWLLALGLFAWSLWLRDPRQSPWRQRLREFLARGSWQIRVDRWTLLVLAVSLIVLFFRVYHLQQTPAEPFSDHAEKLLDVYDVSQGQTHIFFPRNTGREAIQMYWTVLISWIFGTGLSFLSLKIGTVLFGLFTLPYMYLLGKEVAGKRAGLLALFLTGVGYWPNVISRIGLRFPLYPMFVAPLLWYLLRGLRTRNRNDFILAGICMGLGVHGYTPFRIVPLLVVAAVVLYVLHAQSRGARQAAVLWLIVAGLISVILFLPLLRYAIENPELFSYRTLTRLGTLERPLPAPVIQDLLSNTWNALRMFNWYDGVIWVNSIPYRPALDVVTGALFLIGVVLLIVRYIREHHWLDLFLLLSIPILLLPSILSLAFPEENPALNRTSGALVPVFLICALALDGLIETFLTSPYKRAVYAYALTGLLLCASAWQDFGLVFRQFDENFRLNSWNSSEMGAVIKEFGLAFGETDTAWVVPFPYWVDTRLVGVWAGIPNRDFGLWPDQLPDTLRFPGPKLFIAKASLDDPAVNDQKALDVLRQLYPQGSLSLHRSPIPAHDFWIYFVPALSSP